MEIKRFILGEFQVNSYLIIQNNEAILIDVGYEPEKLERYIDKEKIALKGILLTHAHLDHIGGLERIRNKYNAPVYIHEKEQEWLVNPDYNGSNFFPFGQVVCKPADYIIKEENKTLEIGDFQLELITTPGHTPGGVSYFINQWLFTGDTLFNLSIGRTDLYGGNHDLLIETIKGKLFSLPEKTIVFPGHGPETNIGKEKNLNPYVS